MKKIERNEFKRPSLVQDGKNSFEIANSLEVISGGKLSDIARPSASRGSTRSLSQLSIQSKVSFELEALPDEKDIPSNTWSKQNESFSCDTPPSCGNDEEFEKLSNNKEKSFSIKDNYTPKDKDAVSPDDFNKEIRKISRRIIRSKKQSIEVKNSCNNAEKTMTESIESADNSEDVENENLVNESEKESELPPRIKKGLEKIKKLDNILAEKVKMEKEVKADRKRMEKEWQLEMKTFLEWCGDNRSRPVIQQFLALTNGISDESRSDFQDTDDDFTPVFPTELDASELKSNSKASNQEEEENKEENQSEQNDGIDKQDTEGHTSDKKKKKRNFLKRNIELAGHANEIIALTENERLRLDELLADDSDLLLFENPFSKTPKALSIEGYEMDENSKRALNDIDEKLKLLVPETDFQSICSTPFSDRVSVSHRSLNFSVDGHDTNEDARCKEPALQEGKDFRDMTQRLHQIEQELGRIDQLKDEEYDSETPHISHELLRQLIDVDDRLTSSALSILDSSQGQMTDRTLSPASTEDSVLESYRSINTDKSFCSVGV